MSEWKKKYLSEVERDFGKDSRYAQMLRDQIAAEADEKADQETYFIGSRKDPKPRQ